MEILKNLEDQKKDIKTLESLINKKPFKKKPFFKKKSYKKPSTIQIIPTFGEEALPYKYFSIRPAKKDCLPAITPFLKANAI